VAAAKMQWLNISKALRWRKLENNLSSYHNYSLLLLHYFKLIHFLLLLSSYVILIFELKEAFSLQSLA